MGFLAPCQPLFSGGFPSTHYPSVHGFVRRKRFLLKNHRSVLIDLDRSFCFSGIVSLLGWVSATFMTAESPLLNFFWMGDCMVFAQKKIVPCAYGSVRRSCKYLDSIIMKCSYLVTDEFCEKPKPCLAVSRTMGSRGRIREDENISSEAAWPVFQNSLREIPKYCTK